MAVIRVYFSGPGRIPERNYGSDAALDLFTHLNNHEDAPSDEVMSISIEPGEFVDVPCGVAMETPFNHWGLILGRSSSVRKKGLQVYPGVIDPGFRGELMVGCLNVSKKLVKVEHGERIGQIILFENRTMLMTPTRAEQLTGSERGTNGFGSSGK